MDRVSSWATREVKRVYSVEVLVSNVRRVYCGENYEVHLIGYHSIKLSINDIMNILN